MYGFPSRRASDGDSVVRGVAVVVVLDSVFDDRFTIGHVLAGEEASVFSAGAVHRGRRRVLSLASATNPLYQIERNLPTDNVEQA